jgi:Secretion system C-terminal sorting domain
VFPTGNTYTNTTSITLTDLTPGVYTVSLTRSYGSGANERSSTHTSYVYVCSSADCNFADNSFIYTVNDTGQDVFARRTNNTLYATTGNGTFVSRSRLINNGMPANLANCFAENDPRTPVTPLADGCYTIQVQKTGLRLQTSADGYIRQQSANNQINQIWRVDNRGNSQYSFTTQDGTNQVIKVNDGNGYGEWLTLSGYTGDDRQKWFVQQNGSSGQYRLFRGNNITWDLNNYGNSPELQLWGNTSEPFYDYRSLSFQSVSCPTSCNFNVSARASNTNPSCGQSIQLFADCSSGDCNGASYTWSLNGSNVASGASPTLNVPSNNGNYTYTITATKNGCQRTSTVSVNVTGCGGGTLPDGCYTIQVQKTGQRLQPSADGYIHQQPTNNQTNQIWKVENRGNNQFSVATQDGTNRVVKTDSGDFSDWLTLTNYDPNNDRHRWSAQFDGSQNRYRIFRPANNNTWDLNNFGNNPELQIWGKTSEPFQDYRSFYFQSVTCPGIPPPPPGANYASDLDFATCQYVSGWAFNQNAPANPITVDIYINGQLVQGGYATTQARPDVAQYYGTGSNNMYGFYWPIPANYRNGGNLNISVKYGGTNLELIHSPKTAGPCSPTRLAAPIETISEPAFVISPNPSTGQITVGFWLPDDEEGKILAYSITGQQLLEQVVRGTGQTQELTINLDQQTSGLYLIRLQSTTQNRASRLLLTH